MEKRNPGEVAAVFCYPPAVFSPLSDEITGRFLNGWPRFQLACQWCSWYCRGRYWSVVFHPHCIDCAAWETALEYQWVFFFWDQHSLFPAFCPLFHRQTYIFLIFLIALLSFLPLIVFCCLLPVRFLPLPHVSLVDLRVVSCVRSELCCHFSPHWGEETSFIDSATYCPPFSFPQAQAVWFLPTT